MESGKVTECQVREILKTFYLPTNPTMSSGWDQQAASSSSSSTADNDDSKLEYICGNCGFRNKLDPNGRIRCVACGYRILYKARTKRLVQFEAR